MKTNLLNNFLIGLSFLPFLSAGSCFAQSALYTNEFELGDVTLLDGPFRHAMVLNDSVLLAYDVNRLLQPYQKQAGIKQTGAPFLNWSGEIGAGLDGHVGGHYLSALAISYASSRDAVTKTRLKANIDYMLAQMKLCQDVVTDSTNVMYGYVGGVPSSTQVWTNFAAGNFTLFNSSWVPWYNEHKVYAGLRDAWLYLGNQQARTMFLKLCDWGVRLISKLTDGQMQSMLEMEHGGMNEVYADAYEMTGDTKYLTAAKRFSHQTLLTNMKANSSTWLDSKHANTQIPKVIGFERIALLDPTATDYGTASVNFWNNVVGSRSLALGGNSVAEYFLPAANYSKYTTEREGPESCNTYNMLKLSEDLFAGTQNAAYADFYERAVLNHILSTQHPEHGGYVYFTSARPQHYRVYSQVNQAMWCCVGSGMENHGKYGQFIYTHKDSSALYVNLFMASQLDWKAKGLTLKQETRFPYEAGTKLTLGMAVGKTDSFSLFIRHPKWVTEAGFVVTVNGVPITTVSAPQSYLEIKRAWKNGDVILVSLPMKVAVEPLQNYTNYVAITYGPVLLGAKTSAKDLIGLLAGEDRMGHVASGPLNSLTSAPVLIGDRTALADSVKLVSADSLIFKINGFYNNAKFNSLRLQPFYTIHDSRYMMYWWQLTAAQYTTIKVSVDAEEAKVLELDRRTLDFVSPGQQQSEADHFMKTESSTTGVYNAEPYRDAVNGGAFSYRMKTNGVSDSVSLMVRYWGNETGNRTFDVLIDKDTLTKINIANKWKMSMFVNVEYPIPSSMLVGKDSVRVTFDARTGNAAGGVFYLRLLSSARTITAKPYVFNAKEWTTCDVNRAPLTAFTYDSIGNTFTIKKSGLNNLAMRLLPTKTDYYNITNNKIYFLIKGKYLKTGSSDSYIWWFNGYNNGSSIPPSIIVNGSNSETFMLWHIPSQSALSYFMDYSQPFITLTHKGTFNIQAIGLTSSATDYASTFSDVNYYSAEEAAAKYPELAVTLGVPTSLKQVKFALDGITVVTNGNGELLLNAHRRQLVQIFDLLGRPIKSFVLENGQNRTLSLRPGFYLVNGRKVLIN
jgi:uncharacterized protein